MLRSATACGLAALLLSPAAPARADSKAGGAKSAENQDVKAVIAKAVEAKGGAANLDKYKAAVAKLKGTINAQGMEITMSGTSTDEAPDKSRLDATMNVGGQEISFVQVLNGDKGWQGINGNVDELEKDHLSEAREQLYSGQIVDLRGITAKGVKLTALGEKQVEGKPAVGVKVSSEGHRDVTVYFDKSSGLVVRSETKGKDPMNGNAEFDAATVYGDYKKVSGVNVPHKIQVFRDGKPFMVMEMSSITLSEKLPEKTFAKP